MSQLKAATRAITTVLKLESQWRSSPAGRDDLKTYTPYMPFPWPDFIALTAEALPEVTGERFLEIGCGIGTKMMLADVVFGLNAFGIERVPEFAAEAQQHGLAVVTADALGWDQYGDFDLLFFNRVFSDGYKEAELERQVWAGMKSGAVVIAANLLAPPPVSWYPVLDDGEVRRWIAQKP